MTIHPFPEQPQPTHGTQTAATPGTCPHAGRRGTLDYGIAGAAQILRDIHRCKQIEAAAEYAAEWERNRAAMMAQFEKECG